MFKLLRIKGKQKVVEDVCDTIYNLNLIFVAIPISPTSLVIHMLKEGEKYCLMHYCSLGISPKIVSKLSSQQFAGPKK